MTHTHWVVRQNKLEILNDEEKVNTREIHKCDGQAHDGSPTDTQKKMLVFDVIQRKRKKVTRICRFNFFRYGHKEERREGKAIVKTTRASARCVSVSFTTIQTRSSLDCWWSSLQPDLSPLGLVRSNAKPTQRVSPWQPRSAA
jgi:hypothetical protein